MKRSLLLCAFLMLLGYAIVSAQEKKTITGTVQDPAGSVLQGVTVQEKGTSNGTVTDAKGAFTIQAAPAATLVFTFIGFARQEIPVNGQSALDVKLAPDTKGLGEVVVTALGIQKESRKLGYAVSKVGGDLMDKARESNVAYSLEGRVAGLNVSGVSGGPGSSARINLRGVTSFNGGSPLFVIDGVPMDNTNRGTAGQYGGADKGDGISSINPDDIENMTVLKGATAAALYGTRASNGVILITTKSGKKGGKLAIEYNTNLQFDQAVNNTDFQYVYGQGAQGQRPTDAAMAARTGISAWGEKMDGKPTIQLDGKEYPYSPVTNNIQKFYRLAPTFTNTVSTSGGWETGAFRLSLSSVNNQSILRNSGLDRKTVNLNINQQVMDKLKITVMANYVDENNKNRPWLSDAPQNANYGITLLAPNVNQVALQPGYDASKRGAEIGYTDDIFKTNPWFVVNQFVNNIDRKRLISAVAARYDFTDWLYAQARVGYDLTNENYLTVEPWGTAYSSGGTGRLNDLSKRQISELNTDVLIGAHRSITKDIEGDFSVGGNMRKWIDQNVGMNGSQFIIPYLYVPSNLTNLASNYLYQELQTNSAYYTADFTYKGFLNIGTTGRYDVFSTLPSNNRGIFTPSVTGSFIFSELTHLPFLSYGKLRASYAQTSGEAQPYKTQQYYKISNTINGQPLGTFDDNLPNLDLQPYRLKEFEVGTELKFLENRLGLDVSYFRRQTNGEIISATISNASGFLTQTLNLGATRNSGVEAMLNGTPIQTRSFTWNASFNITYVKNLVVDIDGTENPAAINLTAYRPGNGNVAIVKGLPMAQIMAYDYKRDDKGNVIVGDNGIPERGDIKPMGSALPNVFGGLNNDFAYKNFNLSFLIDFKYNNKILSATNYYSIVDGLNKMTLDGRETGVVAQGVTESGAPNTTNVAAYNYYPQLAQNLSALSVLDGSFIKLRQVTLGYTFPAAWFEHTPFQAIAISLVGRNLWTIMKRTPNIDPEAGFSSDIKAAGLEGGNLPAVRTYGVNVNFKFKK